jgi:hypothetical protein
MQRIHGIAAVEVGERAGALAAHLLDRLDRTHFAFRGRACRHFVEKLGHGDELGTQPPSLTSSRQLS